MVYNRPTSFSQNKMFELCPRSWYYKYVKKIPLLEDLKYAHRGNVVHNCLEEYYNDKSLNVDKIKELFEKEWKKYKLDNTTLSPYKNQTWNMIQVGIDLNLDVTSTELKIYYPDVVGYIDVVDSKTETLYDWKTSTISEDNQEEYVEQLKFYSWLYYRKFNSLPKKLQVIYLKYKDDDDKFLTYTPSMEDVKHIENWHNNIRKEMNDYVDNVKKLPPFNKEYFWSPYKHLWEVEKLKPNDMMNFNIVISGNFLFIKGYMDSFLSKHIDNKFSYELKNSHFIKMNNQHANTIVRFWHKSQKRLPIGFLKQVKKTLFDYAQFRKKTPIIEIQDLRVFNKKKIDMPQSLLSDKTLRPYQIEAIDAFVNKGDNIGILELVTGSGKSLIAAEIIRRLQTTTLFIVDKKELMYQMRDVIKEELGIEAGILGDNKKNIKDITVATIQTLIRNKKEFEPYLKTVNLAVFDECFVSKTYINTENGNLTIGNLYKMYKQNKKLPKVLTLNENTNKFEYKNIEKVLRKESENLFNIHLGKNRIKCTPNHKFLTSEGWKTANNLNIGDLIYSYVNDNNKINSFMNNLNEDQIQLIYGSFLGDGSLHILPNKKNYRMKFVHGKKQKKYLEWKIKLINGSKYKNGKSGYSDNTMYIGSSKIFNFGVEFNDNKTCPEELCNKINEKGLAIWFMDDGSFSKKGLLSIIHSNMFDYDTHLTFKKMFKNRFGIDVIINKSKNKYYYLYFDRINSIKLHKLIDKFIHPNLSYKKMFDVTFEDFSNHKEKNGFISVTNIEKIKNRYGEKGYQQKPYVYDLTVEDNHNYVVTNGKLSSGVVVHNCHHTSSKSYCDIGYYLKNTEYRLGITATAYRDDGNDMAITATTGDILYSLTGQSLIEKGYLMKPKIYFITYKIEDDELLEMELESSKGYINETPDYPLNYKSYIADNNTRNELIKKITEDKKDKSILILVKLIEHGKKLEEMIPNSKYLYGNTPKKERMNYLDDFKSGKIRVLISTISIFSEGVNIPSLDIIINASANKGDVKSIQVLGRVLRKNQGKESAEYYDFYDTSTFFYVASAARMQAFMNEGHDVFKVEYIEKKKYINKLDFIL